MEVYQDVFGDDFNREKNVTFAVTEQLEGLEYALSSCLVFNVVIIKQLTIVE